MPCRTRSILILAFCALGLAAVSPAQAIRLEDFGPDKDGMPGEQRYQRQIEIGSTIKLDATVHVTVRRNGTLKVANLKLKILDECDDGLKFADRLLHTEFRDITGDDFKDLVITGTVIHTGEKENDPVSYSTVTSIYAFRPKEKDFTLVFHVGLKLDRAAGTRVK